MGLTKKLVAILALPSILALCIACGEDPLNDDSQNGSNGDNSGGDQEQYEDIKVVDGKVRFYLQEKSNSTRTATNMTARDWAKSKVEMNGKSYSVELSNDKTPRPYIEVPQADKYEAVLLTSSSNKWYAKTPKSDIKFPYSQFYHTAVSDIKSFPMYASYTKENGNKLIFSDGFALVYVRLKGMAKITSVKVENPMGKAIAGYSALNSKGEFVIKRGMDFAVLNTTNEGKNVQLSSSKYTNFRVMIAPGTYSKGLKITICDAAHQAVFVNTDAVTLAAGDLHTIEMEYAPDEDLVYYEGYDNMVWGGDVMKGSEGFGFAPTSDAVTIDSGATLTGYEEAFAEVAYNSAGTGYIQSNTWADVVGKSVAQSHRMSDSYIASRNLADEMYLFRTYEHPGYIAVGVVARGMFTSSRTPHTKSIGRVKYTIQMAVQSGFNGNLQLMVNYGGVIESLKVNGKELDSSHFTYENASAIVNHLERLLPVPSSATEPNKWSSVELEVNGATDGTRIYIADENSGAGVHGAYINSIEARQMNEWVKKEGTLRVMQWNLLYGMWQDQHLNYDNFVKFVKKYDPDVCIWCESETIYKDETGAGVGNGPKFLPDGWAVLGTRYGHSYAATGGDHDNFPQSITSKYPIKTIKKITDTDVKGKPISHGAGHFVIDVDGKKINIVTMHLWPQSYGYGITDAAEREASIAKNEGHYYREFEMQYIIDQTVNNPNNANEEYWILGGDTNSRSPLDAWYHNHTADDLIMLPHKLVRDKTNLKDVIGDVYPRNYFLTTTYSASRIDILYASPKMFDCIENSITLIDNWCYPRVTDNVKGWYYPSDHRPVLVDFKLK
ncbi:MAG: metal-dependent hydrolase [Alistipes sp.]|nr:metal-dependent hydrolase [Alistipes sp.]